jgi:uncharacterized delta-60 repeat protein
MHLARGTLGFLASLIAVGVLCAPAALAVSGGDRNLSFGDNGTVIQDVFGGFDDSANAVAIQADGKIVVAGRWGFPTLPKGHFARYNPTDASLDTSFSGDGKLTLSFGGHESAEAVAIQADGKIVAAGTHNGQDYDLHFDQDFVLVRYHASNNAIIGNTAPAPIIESGPSAATNDATPTFGLQPTATGSS